MSFKNMSQDLSVLVAYRVGQAGSPTRLADALEISQAYISQLISGQRKNPSPEVLEKLGIKTVYELLEPGDVDLHHEMRKIIEANRIAGERS